MHTYVHVHTYVFIHNIHIHVCVSEARSYHGSDDMYGKNMREERTRKYLSWCIVYSLSAEDSAV